MTAFAIRTGTMQELHAHSGDRVFVYLGFSRGNKTCGYLHLPADHDRRPPRPAIGDLTTTVVELVRRDRPPLRLVREVPLSDAYGGDSDPLCRSVARQASATRYRYVGLECSVRLASPYLLKALLDAEPVREVRIFEGPVPFKDGTKPSDHPADVDTLKAAVWSGGTTGGAFSEPTPLDGYRDTRVTATLALLGIRTSPPPIIQGTPL